MTTAIVRLNPTVRKNGFTYQLVERSNDVAIYEQQDNGRTSGYEIFKITVQRERVFEGRHFPRKEKFPANEDFGKSAWSISDFGRAYSKYLQLTGHEPIKEVVHPVKNSSKSTIDKTLRQP